MEPESRIFETPAGRWSVFFSSFLCQLLVLVVFAGFLRGAFLVGANHYIAHACLISSLRALEQSVNNAMTYGLVASVCLLLPMVVVAFLSKSRAKTAASVFFGALSWLGLMILTFVVFHSFIGKQQFPFFCRDAESLQAFLFRAVVTRLEPARYILLILIFGGGLTLLSVIFYIGLWRRRDPSPEWSRFMQIPLGKQLRTWGLIGLLVGGVNYFSWTDGFRPTPEGPNVLFISVDTLRDDAVDCVGARERTPHLCALADQGIRFSRAYATSPWTLPSHGSMFASRLPGELPLTTVAHRLGEKWITLAEAFENRGYRTAGFVSHLFVSRSYGFDQGFSRFVMFEDPGGHTAPKLVRQYIDQVQRPWFCFVHLFDAHWPYAPLEGEELAGFSGADLEMLAERSDYYRFMKGAAKASERGVARLKEAYLSEVSQVDRQIGEMLNSLNEKGILGNTIILVASDHGEAFGEKGAFGHGFTLDGQVLRVPMILAAPPGKMRPGIIEDPVDLRDIAPTLAGLAGLDVPDQWNGRNLSQSDGKTGFHIAQTSLTVRPAVAVMTKTQKYMTAMEATYRDIRFFREESLFFLPDDEGENANLIDALPDSAAKLKNAALAAPDGTQKAGNRPVLTEKERERLSSLGYLY